jgi:hypothetical protein
MSAELLRACNAALRKSWDRSARAGASAPDPFAKQREFAREYVKQGQHARAAAAAAEGTAAASEAAAAPPQPELGTERGVDVPVLVAGTLYTMGFESERVNWALEQSGHRAAAALEMLLLDAQRGAPAPAAAPPAFAAAVAEARPAEAAVRYDGIVSDVSDERREVIDLCSDDDEPRDCSTNAMLKALRDERELRERKMESRGQKRSRA